jgi:hypothetical protein
MPSSPGLNSSNSLYNHKQAGKVNGYRYPDVLFLKTIIMLASLGTLFRKSETGSGTEETRGEAGRPIP